jgi:hypothetical protein
MEKKSKTCYQSTEVRAHSPKHGVKGNNVPRNNVRGTTFSIVNDLNLRSLVSMPCALICLRTIIWQDKFSRGTTITVTPALQTMSTRISADREQNQIL